MQIIVNCSRKHCQYFCACDMFAGLVKLILFSIREMLKFNVWTNNECNKISGGKVVFKFWVMIILIWYDVYAWMVEHNCSRWDVHLWYASTQFSFWGFINGDWKLVFVARIRSLLSQTWRKRLQFKCKFWNRNWMYVSISIIMDFISNQSHLYCKIFQCNISVLVNLCMVFIIAKVLVEF